VLKRVESFTTVLQSKAAEGLASLVEGMRKDLTAANAAAKKAGEDIDKHLAKMDLSVVEEARLDYLNLRGADGTVNLEQSGVPVADVRT
jgi:hypothetical protein